MTWLAGWSYRKKHEINGSSAGAETNYQVKVVIHYGSGTDSGENVYLNGECRTDFGDIRFTDDDGTTLLDYWMEEKVDSDYAVFWVEVPSIPSSPDTATIYIYYGKSDATYSGSGKDTFLEFYDFTTDESSDWTVYQGDWTWDTANGLLKLINTGGHLMGLKTSYGSGIAVRTKMRFTGATQTTNGFGQGIMIQDVDNYYYPRLSFADELQFRKKVAGSATTVASTSFTVDNDVWYIMESRVISSSHITVVADSTTLDVTSGLESWTSGYPGVYAYISTNDPSAEAHYDYFLIRKYIDPEPSHGAWYPQEAYQELSESVSVSDVFSRTWTIDRSYSESISISDVFSRIWSVYRSFPETLSLTDTVTALKVLVKELTETLGLSDAITKFASVIKSETLSLTDIVEKVKTIYRELSETLGLTDRISKLTQITRTESLSLSDILEKRFVILKILTETLGLSDTLARIRIKKTLARIKGVTRILSAIREKPAERELGK